MHTEITVLAEGIDAAAWAVGVALLLADVDDEARMECAAVNRIREDCAMPIGIAACDAQIAEHHLRLDGSRQVHEIHAAAERMRRDWKRRRLRLRRTPLAEDFFHLGEHFLRHEIADENQQSAGRRIIFAVEILELFPFVRGNLVF
jgi:hypothetical protein